MIDLISDDMIEIEKHLKEFLIMKMQKDNIIKKIKDIVIDDNVRLLLDEYEKLDKDTDPYNIVSGLITKIKSNTNNITLSLQVQDITSQQLAAVNHLIVSVQERLASLILNIEEAGTNEAESIGIVVPEGSHFDPDAKYSKTDGRQDVVDSIINNHQTSQDEIDKLFS